MTDQPTGPPSPPSPPSSPPPGPPPVPPSASGAPRPPAGPPPGSHGWYSGPIPLTGLVPRESIGRAVLRTSAKALAGAVALGTGLAFMLFVAVVGLAALAGGLAPASGDDDLSATFVAGDEGNRNTLLAIPVTGIILGERTQPPSLLELIDATYGYEVKEDLEAAARRNDIKGIVLELDTPGGTIFGARAIADAVAEYQARTGRPVVAYVRGVSASGGVYAMAGADRIVADHGTLVGSIGVIFGPLTNYKGVVATEGGVLGGGVETTGGVTEEYITAGRGKDLGNPYRELTAEERTTLQTSVDNSYADFVDHVATGRELTPDAVRSDLGALVFDEQSAMAKGLVDQVGNRDAAYGAAAEAASLEPGNYQVTRLDTGPPGLFGLGAELAGAARGDGTDDDAPAAAPNACTGGPVLLAYFGDPATWCR